MRLWQRIFLLTTAMVILGISAVSYVILNSDFTTNIENIRENTVLISDNVEENINSLIFSHATKHNNFILSQDIVENLVNKVCSELETDFVSISCIPNPEKHLDIFSKNFSAYTTSKYIEEDNQNYIVSTKMLMLEGVCYTLNIRQNITTNFIQFNDTISYVQVAATGIATFIALVLLIVIQIIMSPIKNINKATKVIADGNYSCRIEIKDKSEIGEVATNMNIMASAIEKNVSYIEDIADSRLHFISNMTHELKTPLTSILGFANIMVVKSEISDDERREYAQIIENETKRLKSLTSKLMELVSLSNTSLETKPENLRTVLLEIFSSMSTILKSKQLTLKGVADEEYMDMDKELFKSLIYNFLDNAIKASPEDSLIEIYEKKVENHIEILIRDHGVGIPTDKLPHVTEAFYMGDKARSRKAGGAGIGLSLCKEICKIHNGKMFIASEVGKGTAIRLIFPLSKKGGSDET